MTEEIRRAIYLLRGEGVLHGRIRSFEQDWCTQQADALEKLLAVYEAAEEYHGLCREPNRVKQAQAYVRLINACNAVQTRQPNSPLMAAGEYNQESSKSGAVGASAVSGREPAEPRHDDSGSDDQRSHMGSQPVEVVNESHRAVKPGSIPGAVSGKPNLKPPGWRSGQSPERDESRKCPYPDCEWDEKRNWCNFCEPPIRSKLRTS